MHRFEYLATAFWNIYDWAADMRDDLYAWPWPLSYLGYPFAWFAYHMWWVAFNTDRISSWADDVWDRLGGILTWYDTYWLIRKYFPLLNKTWYDVLNAMPTWSSIKPYWFPSTLSRFIAMMPTWEDIVPYWVPTSWSDFKDKVVDCVADRFERILDRVFAED